MHNRSDDVYRDDPNDTSSGHQHPFQQGGSHAFHQFFVSLHLGAKSHSDSLCSSNKPERSTAEVIVLEEEDSSSISNGDSLVVCSLICCGHRLFVVQWMLAIHSSLLSLCT